MNTYVINDGRSSQYVGRIWYSRNCSRILKVFVTSADKGIIKHEITHNIGRRVARDEGYICVDTYWENFLTSNELAEYKGIETSYKGKKYRLYLFNLEKIPFHSPSYRN